MIGICMPLVAMMNNYKSRVITWLFVFLTGWNNLVGSQINHLGHK